MCEVHYESSYFHLKLEYNLKYRTQSGMTYIIYSDGESERINYNNSIRLNFKIKCNLKAPATHSVIKNTLRILNTNI